MTKARVLVFLTLLAGLLVTSGCADGCGKHEETGTPITSLPVETPSTAPRIQALELAGYLGTEQPWRVAIQGDRAYAGAGIELAVLDLADPAHPARAGYLLLPSTIRDVAASGSYVYAATGSSGLQVIDASSPTRPTVLNTYFEGTDVNGIVVEGNYAYVANGELHVLDISDPAAPSEVGIFTSPDLSAQAGVVAAVADGLAYAIYYHPFARAGGFRIIDVSDPTDPIQIGVFDAGIAVHSLTVVNDHVYLLAGQGIPCLSIVDVGNPTDPNPVGSGPTTCQSGQGLIATGRYLILATPGTAENADHLQALDISSPTEPVEVGNKVALTSPVTNLTVADNHLYVSTVDGIAILDISDVRAAVRVGTFRLDSLPLPGRDLVLDGHYAYVAAGESGLQVADLSDPSAPSVVSNINTPGHAWDVALAGEYAYLASESEGLRIIDVADPLSPVERGAFDIPGPYEFFHGVEVAEDYAYIADGGLLETGLRVIDISDPSHPVEIGFLPLISTGSHPLPPRAEGVTAVGTYVYLAAGTAGLRVIDVADPTTPVEIGSYDTPGRAYSLAVVGDYAYLIDGDLRIIDISDPTVPALVGFYDLPESGTAGHVAIQGDQAFVTGSDFRVLDISNPVAPSEAYIAPIPSQAVSVAGDTVYTLGNGLFILRAIDDQP